jgi:hypothetical protein
LDCFIVEAEAGGELVGVSRPSLSLISISIRVGPPLLPIRIHRKKFVNGLSFNGFSTDNPHLSFTVEPTLLDVSMNPFRPLF